MPRRRERPPAIEAVTHHPLEEIAVEMVRRAFEGERWPFDRLPVQIIFGLRPGVFADFSMTRVSIRDGRPTGQPIIWLNYLFLIQDPTVFLSEVVPHVVAHLMAETGAMKQGIQIEEHGSEFVRHFMALTDSSPRGHAVIEKHFDDRPLRLLRSSYVMLACECAGLAGFHVITKKRASKINEEGSICAACGYSYRYIEGEGEIPEELTADVTYLRSEIDFRGPEANFRRNR